MSRARRGDDTLREAARYLNQIAEPGAVVRMGVSPVPGEARLEIDPRWCWEDGERAKDALRRLGLRVIDHDPRDLGLPE